LNFADSNSLDELLCAAVAALHCVYRVVKKAAVRRRRRRRKRNGVRERERERESRERK
jgi:hypothetical protein